MIDAEFIPFIDRHRKGDYKKKFIDFYKFTNKEKPATNNGTGTSFMHTYMDKIEYYKSEGRGLAVVLTKNKQ